jgi:hypothetical protein
MHKNRKKFAIAFCALIVCVCFLFFSHILTFVKGGSMEPTLHTGNILIVNVFNKSPNLNEIIVFKKQNKIYVKRVKYITGYYYCQYSSGFKLERLCSLLNEHLYGILKKDSHSELKKQHFYSLEGKYWVEGDNLVESENSDIYGPVEKNEVIGTVNNILKIQ